MHASERSPWRCCEVLGEAIRKSWEMPKILYSPICIYIGDQDPIELSINFGPKYLQLLKLLNIENREFVLLAEDTEHLNSAIMEHFEDGTFTGPMQLLTRSEFQPWLDGKLELLSKLIKLEFGKQRIGLCHFDNFRKLTCVWKCSTRAG